MTEAIPRPEYPRPQFVRDEWLNLNGEWEFAFDDVNQGLQLGWHDGRTLPGRITVPFAYQTPLSGINDKSIHEYIWYARSFEIPGGWHDRDILLNFGAVDYSSTVWINGQEVGHNNGGHVPFQFEIAPYLHPGPNRLTLRVEDRQDPRQPRGKQSFTGLPFGIDYYCTAEAVAYQCYAVQEPIDISVRADRQKKKITTDTTKIVSNITAGLDCDERIFPGYMIQPITEDVFD